MAPKYTLHSAAEFKSEARLSGGKILCVRKELAGIEMTESEGKLSFIISTAAVDRDNDSVSQGGWKLDNYLKNPVMLWAHDYSQLPVGKPSALTLENGNLCAKDIEFTPRELNEFGWAVGELYRKGFLNAVSVGFRPLAYKWNDPRGPMACDYHEQELLEFSAVPVPSNPEALLQAKSMGIPMAPLVEWAEHILDTKGAMEALPIPREEVEKLYKAAKPAVAYSVPHVEEKAAEQADESDEDTVAEGLTQAIVELTQEMRVFRKSMKSLQRAMEMKASTPVPAPATPVQTAPLPAKHHTPTNQSQFQPVGTKVKPTEKQIAAEVAKQIAAQVAALLGRVD